MVSLSQGPQSQSTFISSLAKKASKIGLGKTSYPQFFSSNEETSTQASKIRSGMSFGEASSSKIYPQKEKKSITKTKKIRRFNMFKCDVAYYKPRSQRAIFQPQKTKYVHMRRILLCTTCKHEGERRRVDFHTRICSWLGRRIKEAFRGGYRKRREKMMCTIKGPIWACTLLHNAAGIHTKRVCMMAPGERARKITTCANI